MSEGACGDYTDELIEHVLSSSAPIENYYISQRGDDTTALMHYFTSDGKHWTVMEDDEAFADACIIYLKKRGAKVFHDPASLIQYQRELESKADLP
jgi:hypothetical protein